MSMKRFTFEECLWYFKHLQKEFAIGTFVKYRHIKVNFATVKKKTIDTKT